MALIIWHNPRCSKSRQTLALIEAHAPEVRLYLTDAPSEAELRAAAKALGLKPIEMMRTGEPEFKAEGLSQDSSEDALFAAMARVPKLIERPMVFAGAKAAIGRPPEAVLGLL
ncbi:arsenate reductase (glutaredoxin) [Lentibacter sp.]|uniref:arsenate reductase (glutaredoxin) n=1 Tax=Lentibacter sp. TaxID=2024994 RepID=UPI003F6A48FA